MIQETRRKNLRTLIKRYKTQKEFCDATGLDPGHVSQMLNETRSIGEKMARKIESVTYSPNGWLDKSEIQEPAAVGTARVGEPLMIYRTVIVDWESPEALPPEKHALILCKQASIDPNTGHLLYKDTTSPPLTFPTQWIKKNQLHRGNLVTIEASGDSMVPRIYNGDVLLVDRGQTEVQDGKIYALRYGHELRAKRLYRHYDGDLILRSYNREAYPDETVPVEALNRQLEIIGRVVWASGEIDS